MSNNQKMAEAIVIAAGGAGNIKSITNCATRLRMYIKNPSKFNEEKMKKFRVLWDFNCQENSIR